MKEGMPEILCIHYFLYSQVLYLNTARDPPLNGEYSGRGNGACQMSVVDHLFSHMPSLERNFFLILSLYAFRINAGFLLLL